MVPQLGHRRSRSHVDEDGDAEALALRNSQSPSTSSLGKRRRMDGSGSENTPPYGSPQPENASGLQRRHRKPYSTINENDGGADTFQAGSIVRVKLTDFVTYESAEFFPGPNLNMVIGPNGTGKSSLVCAICLGLGWGPKHLGRAGEVGEFVKHNQEHAFIEIELQGLPGEDNHVVKVKIIRDGNGREWWLNGKKSSLKAVQALCRSLSIQIDNLCQFLPQDKVSEFAGLSPVELLQQTQRAAAPPEMLEWHDKLKGYRKEQKTLEEELVENNELLRANENRIASLQAQKEQLEEINDIKDQVDMLKKSIPFIKYKFIRVQQQNLKERRAEAVARLQRLKEESQPSLEAVNRKKHYHGQIKAVVQSRKRKLQTAEQDAQKAIADIEAIEKDIQEVDADIEEEKKNDKKRVQDVSKLRQKLASMTAQARMDPPEFNGLEWNEKIRAKNIQIREMDNETSELKIQEGQLRTRGKEVREEIENYEREIAQAQTQEGQQLKRIESLSSDTAKAWKWIQEHRAEFEQEVYAPALISCSIKDPKYIPAIEAILDQKNLLAITTQTPTDFEKLSRKLFGSPNDGSMGLAHVTIRSVQDDEFAQVKYPPMSVEEARKCGLDGWALDYIDGPEPVLAMLCGGAKVNSAGVSLKDVTESQHEMLVQGPCNSWVAGRTSYRVTNRKEYGPSATSTTTKMFPETPRFWTDRPVDTSANRELQAKIDECRNVFNDLKNEIMPLRERLEVLKGERTQSKEDVAQLTKEKNELQKLHGEYMALPGKMERLQESIDEKEQAGVSLYEKIRKKNIQQDGSVLRKLKKIIQHKELVEAIRTCHVELLDVKVRLVEAESDVESLEARNHAVLESIEREAQLVRNVEAEFSELKAKGKVIQREVTTLLAEADAAGKGGFFRNLPDISIEDREAEIVAEEAKLEFMHASNPNAIRDFELRKVELEKLQEKIAAAEERLTKLSRHITKVRDRWEPALDALIAEISDAFSYNFEQIGCAGEVSIHKDDDFDQWAIQIKVKFRQSESLQILDQHRQSGGERSVSTIFYLMSLQSLAQSPFRVVDEINQGMDPRNERMVHERMVEIACKEHTSQYFLITPKLLTGLRYDKNMRTHVINSGKHVTADPLVNAVILRKKALMVTAAG